MKKTDIWGPLGFLATIITFLVSVVFQFASFKYSELAKLFFSLTILIGVITICSFSLKIARLCLPELRGNKIKVFKIFVEKIATLSSDHSTYSIRSAIGCASCTILTIIIGISSFNLAVSDLNMYISPGYTSTTTPLICSKPTCNLSTPTPVLKPTRLYQGRIAAGYNFTVALKDDGTVVCIGGNGDIDVENWSGIKQIAAYGNHVLGLYENGKVAFAGKSVSGEKNVTGWSDIVQVAACYGGSIGLTVDGHLVYAGNEQNVQVDYKNWANVTKIFGGSDRFAGITKSGTVLLSSYDNLKDRLYLGRLDSIATQVCFTNDATYLLFDDGTVSKFYSDNAGKDSVENWFDIKELAGGDEHIAGLRADGTVVTMGNNEFGQCDVRSWTDIIAIYCGQYHTIGLKSDGTVVATGLNDEGQCNVEGIDLW